MQRTRLERQGQRRGYVTRFQVEKAFLDSYPVQQAGGADHLGVLDTREELPEFNSHIVGLIEVVAELR